MLLVVGSIACFRATGGPEPGAASSEGAVQQFLFAAKAQDLQAISAVWGNEESLVRDREERRAMERRLIIINCHLKHDESRIGPAERGEGGRVLHRVDLTQGELKASPVFTTVRNAKSGRWFVETFDLTPLKSFCRGAGAAPPTPDGAAPTG